MKNLRSERGQAIVVIVFAIFGLLAMGALAIDIGQLYAARRNAQNAADAAALAAAYDMAAGSKSKTTAKDIAFEMTRKNGFSNDKVTNWVVVNNPAKDSPYCECGSMPNPENYFQVQVTVRLKPIFSQFIFSGLKESTVEAVAHYADADEMSAGNALMSLDEKSDDSMELDGTTKVNITGGNIRSNGGLWKSGASGSIKVTSGSTYYATTKPNKFGPFNPLPKKQAAAHISPVAPPACPASAADASGWSSAGGVKYKTDATYGSTTFVHASVLKSSIDLAAGIHCFYDGIDMTGGDKITGQDVLIVMMGGDVKMKGNSTFDLSAATDLKDSKGNQFGGMVFYVPASNTGTFEFGGTNGGVLYGVVYAPKATCDIGGNPNNTANHTAVICNKIKIHGTPDLVIQYNPEELFHFPPLVELVQ